VTKRLLLLLFHNIILFLSPVTEASPIHSLLQRAEAVISTSAEWSCRNWADRSDSWE